MGDERDREVERLRKALRGCVEWMETGYIRDLMTYAAMHAAWKPSPKVIECADQVWGEARAALGMQSRPHGLDGGP